MKFRARCEAHATPLTGRPEVEATAYPEGELIDLWELEIGGMQCPVNEYGCEDRWVIHLPNISARVDPDLA